MSLNILWLGTLSIDGNISKKSSESPAAKRFQNSFIKAFLNLNNKVTIFSYNPYPLWPKGPFYVHCYKKKFKYFYQINTNYINLPLIREFSIFIGFLFSNKLSDLLKYDLVISYNESFQNLIFGFLLQILGKKWLSIFAEGIKTKNISNNILHLSYYSYKNKIFNSKKNNILFPLAIYPRDNFKKNIYLENILKNTKKPYILYTGAINYGTGIFNFIVDFYESKLSNFYQLVICGRGKFPSNLDHFLLSENISFLGFLKEEELDFLSYHCAAFINPRLTHNIIWLNNLPSKLLGYLSYDSPTFSTMTENLTPDLRELIIPYKSAEDILAKLLNEKLINEHLYLLNNKRCFHTWEKAINEVLQKVI